MASATPARRVIGSCLGRANSESPAQIGQNPIHSFRGLDHRPNGRLSRIFFSGQKVPELQSHALIVSDRGNPATCLHGLLGLTDGIVRDRLGSEDEIEPITPHSVPKFEDSI